MGEVYLAEDPRLQRRVAIKRIRADLASDPGLRQRLFTEALAVARLDHPNICGIYEIGEDDEGPFIVMSYVEGDTLESRLAQGLLPIDAVLDIGAQLADAVSAAHAQGILHRDLKPANVIVDRRGTARVMDFGLAKLADRPGAAAAETRPDLTTVGVPIGTTAYMSPEQARGEPLDARSDVFSLGVILYQMVTGHRPFTGASMGELVTAILSSTPVPVSRARPDTPEDLARIISKALRKARDERYQTAPDLLADLRTLRRHTSTSEPPNEAAPRVAPRLLPRGSMWWAVAAGLVLAVAIPSWLARRDPSSIPTTVQIRSLAVLPLANHSGDPAQGYFAGGMTDAVRTELARVKELRIMSGNFSRQLKAAGENMSTLASDSQVDGLIDGSVMRVGNQVRISAELIRVSSGEIIWRDEYDGDLTDVLGLQRRVAQDIAARVRVTVSPELRRTLATSRSVQARAQELYLKGRQQLQSSINAQPFRTEGIAEAIRTFEAASAIEPNWANPWAALGEAKQWMSHVDPQRLFTESRDAALKAIDLDDDHADAHSVLAYALSAYFWEWQPAEREYQRCIALNPSGGCFHGYGMMLTALGRFNEADAAFAQAKERDPLSPQLRINSVLSRIRARAYDAAEREAREMITAGMDLRFELAWAVAWKGRPDEAITLLRPLATDDSEGAEEKLKAQAALISVLVMAGKRGEALSLLPALERANKDLERTTMSGARHLAGAYAHLGNREAALATLERAYATPPAWLAAINVDPSFETLRGDARFQDLLRRMRLRD